MKEDCIDLYSHAEVIHDWRLYLVYFRA